MDEENQIRKLLSEISSDDPAPRLASLRQFADFLLEANQKFNLVSRQDSKALVQDLIIDSLALMPIVNYERDATLLDIGSGAGFPGLVQKIARPDLTLISVDSNKKKIEFQKAAAALLRLEKCQFKADRVESIALEPVDYAIAKGVGSIDQICRWARPHLKGGGILILPRGVEEPFTIESPVSGFTLLQRREYSKGQEGRSAVVLMSKSAEPMFPWVVSQDN